MAPDSESSAGTDVCIFGATGFTGKHVLKAWIKLATAENEGRIFSVSIAGRSRRKLEDVLLWAGLKESEVPIILADVDNEESLDAMCKQTKIVLNCVGPFRYWGEPVVKACVKNGVHYLDVSGEPEFMEKMEAAYHEAAVENNVLVASGCGFDCIPADLGVLHAARQFPLPGAPNSVESFLSIRALHGVKFNHGTWESLVQGIANASNLRKLRSSRPRPPPLPTPGPAPKRHNDPYWESRVRAYALPFPGADASVVKRSMQYFAAKKTKDVSPVHYAAYFTIQSIWHVLMMGFYGLLVKNLALFGWGRSLLLKYPKFFSHGAFSKDGLTDEEMEGTSCTFLFFSKGYSDLSLRAAGKPDRQVVTRVHTPEPGYVATPIILVQAALCLLANRDSLASGGVLTPGALFAGTDLESRLHKNGITFSAVGEELP